MKTVYPFFSGIVNSEDGVVSRARGMQFLLFNPYNVINANSRKSSWSGAQGKSPISE